MYKALVEWLYCRYVDLINIKTDSNNLYLNTSKCIIQTNSKIIILRTL